jgi:hypothetical protein
VERDQDPNGARADLAGAWKRRLAALLHEYPDAETDLAELIDQVRGKLPPDGLGWVQVSVARDHGIVNAVRHGSQYTFYIDSPDPRDRPNPEAGDADT